MMMSNAGGRVVWVSPALRFGGTFAANEPLLRIDSIDYEILVKDTEAELRRAQAELRKEELKGAAESARFCLKILGQRRTAARRPRSSNRSRESGGGRAIERPRPA